MKSLNAKSFGKSYDVVRSYRDTGVVVEVTEVFLLPYNEAKECCKTQAKIVASLEAPPSVDQKYLAEVKQDKAALDAVLPA